VGDFSYEQILAFSQSWGSLYFMILFLAVCVYALWPSNKATFDKAARVPLQDDESCRE
jgi:cytochrome c oxidase cbb3-type subunit 4